MRTPEPPVSPPDYDEHLPECPVCGEEADTFYKNSDGDIVGCMECIRAVDAL